MTNKKNIIDKKLLEIVVCPITKEKLVYDEKNSELISKKLNWLFQLTMEFL